MGKIGITLVSTWMIPYSNSTLDRHATLRALDFMLGWWVLQVTSIDMLHSHIFVLIQATDKSKGFMEGEGEGTGFKPW